MNLHFLGYTASIQTKEASNTSLALQSQNETVVVDLSGSPVSALLASGIGPLSVELIVLTHAHIDHIYGLPSLIHQLWLLGRKAPLRIVANTETLAVAKELVDIFSLEEKRGIFAIKWLVATEGEFPLSVGGMKITFFNVQHGVPTLGVTFESESKKVAFFADCAKSDAYYKSVYRADILVHEAGGTKEEEEALAQSGHSSAREAALVAQEIEAKRLILAHLPPSGRAQAALLLEAQHYFANTSLPTLYEAIVV